MHILVATDADYVVDDVTAALSGPDVSFTVVRDGRSVSKVVEGRTPDLAILDLQIGSMGGMAVTMDLRLDESAGVVPHIRVLMLLDRVADVHLAKRCGAEAWLVKPVDSFTLKRTALGIIAAAVPIDEPEPETLELDPVDVESAEEEPAPAG